MATFFSENDIDEFRECFYLFAREGYIKSLDELTMIMRSLGANPTVHELKKYYKSKVIKLDNQPTGKPDGQPANKPPNQKTSQPEVKIKFSDFLDIMEEHSKVEDSAREILKGFRAYDTGRRGVIAANDFKYMLSRWGEPLNQRQVTELFREANLPSSGNIKYEDLVNWLCQPKPDY